MMVLQETDLLKGGSRTGTPTGFTNLLLFSTCPFTFFPEMRLPVAARALSTFISRTKPIHAIRIQGTNQHTSPSFAPCLAVQFVNVKLSRETHWCFRRMGRLMVLRVNDTNPFGTQKISKSKLWDSLSYLQSLYEHCSSFFSSILYIYHQVIEKGKFC